MSKTTAVLSLLHEGASPANSAERAFRGKPVLAWTLERLGRASKVDRVAIVCWEDQAGAVKRVAGAARVCAVGPRVPLANLETISAAQRWSDGWRGGLLATCHFDRGFHGPFAREAVGDTGAEDLVVLVDPAAGLVDPALVDALVGHARGHSKYEFFFTQAAPGLAGVVMRPALLERLAKTVTHAGRLMSYWPDLPGRDPMTTDMCLAVPPAIARTLGRFALDSERQVRRLTGALNAAVGEFGSRIRGDDAESGGESAPSVGSSLSGRQECLPHQKELNGELVASDAERIVAVAEAYGEPDAQPREVVLELTTRRGTRPIYAPGSHLELGREDASLDLVERVLGEISGIDDVRLTLAGAGDPLLHPEFARILRAVAGAGVRAVHVETDLVAVADDVWPLLLDGTVDVLSVHLPAATAEGYRRVMGVDAMTRVLQNMQRLLTNRRTLPLVVPTFTKCRQNLDEMEPWYDHWLRVLGTAVIAGASDYAGQIPDVACADMSPPRRRPCQRLGSRMTVLSDGTIASCEQDVLGRQRQGDARVEGVGRTWRERFPILRGDHEKRELCTSCKEWHRP
jgi:hypothetical protein